MVLADGFKVVIMKILLTMKIPVIESIPEILCIDIAVWTKEYGQL